MDEQLAIIRNVGIGMRDCSKPVLWFTAYTDEHSASLQVFDWDTAREIIEAAGVYDAHKLEGWPCWVEVKDAFVTFKRVWPKSAGTDA